MRARVVTVLVLALVGAAALWSGRPPAPAPVDTPATEFSAARALPVVDDLARAPRPLGSPAAARVRDDLVGRLTALGLTTRVDASTGIRSGNGTVRAAAVDDVVGTLPGTAPTGAVVLAAHDDSVAAGPGAADDASSVAAVLETVRALRAGPPLRDDVVVLFTDGEEAGLLGAQAWVRDHLPRDRPTVVLNHEARGVSGPSLIFQTSPGNAGLVAAIADAVPHPFGDSSLVAIYRLLPNDTDLSEVLAAGRPGVNSAFIEDPVEYHTAGDSPANLDPASVQSQGSTMLALARELATQDLRPVDPVASGLPAGSGGDAVYFGVLGVLVTYPQGAVWPVALLAAAALVGAVAVGRRRGVVTLRGVGLAAATAPLPVAIGLGLGAALWEGLVAVRPAYADVGPFLGRSGFYEAADVVLAALAVLLWWLPLRRLGPLTLGLGATTLLAVLGLLGAAVLPGASFLAAWPALGAALGLGVAVLRGGRGPVALAAVVVGLVPAAVLLLPFALSLFGIAEVAGGLAVPGFVLLGLLLVALFAPAEGPRSALLAPAAAVLAVVVLAGTGLVVDRPDAAHPRSSHLAYVLDADTGTASWVTRDTVPAAWTVSYADGPPTTPAAWPGSTPVRTGPAPAPATTPPTASVLARSPTGVTLRLSSPRGATTVALRSPVPLTAVTVTYPGRAPVSVRTGSTATEVVLDAMPPAGVDVELTLARPGPTTLTLDDRTDGLAAVPGFVARPADLRRSPERDSDLVVVDRRVTLGP